MAKKKSKAETSEVHTGIKTGKPKDSAAGIPAVISSMQHVLSEMSITRGAKVLMELNQKGGVDCPGCAWPDPDDDRSRIGEYCENGAKAIAEEATSKKLTPKFFADNKVSELAELSDYKIGRKGRIAQPMYLKKGSDNYEEINWDEAFRVIARHLKALDSPDEAIFYTSGRTSNEAAFLYQLFVREYGTNNLPDCSNMCHESSGVALGETLGIGKGSVKLEDFYEAEVIMIMGQNPGTNHPRMLNALEKAKENGARIVSINPIVESGLVSFKNPQKITAALGRKTKLTDVYLQVRINADMALLQAINKLLLEKETAEEGGILDPDFIQEKTEGFADYRKHLKELEFENLVSQTGIARDKIEFVADLIARNKKIIVCWAMGLTQHKNSVATIKEVVNMLLMKGSIGKPGAGTCPVRGHSNVQGDRTMGIHEKPPKRLLDSIKDNFGFEPPRKHGFDVVSSIEAMHAGEAKVFFGMGGNFLSATPDTLYTAEALENCELTVHVSTKLNRSHLVHGKEALILPCLARTDKDHIGEELQIVSVENSMGVVHSSKGSLVPVSDKLISEAMIVCNLAEATLPDSKVKWSSYKEHYDNIRSAIEKTIPGFSDYNKRVRVPGGFYLPNCARANEFNTPTKKAQFTVSDYEPIKVGPGEFLMMTIRSHDQFNTTIYGLDDRYRGIYNERRVILMNVEDMKKGGLQEKDVVDLFNHHDQKERRANGFYVIPYSIPSGCVATYFPEANVLVPIKSRAKKSNTPTSKSVIITIKSTDPV